MKQSVLVVDDDYFTRKLLEVLLSQAGYSVYQADDTKQARQVLADTPIDVITCDVMMPEMDGFSFLISLRGDPQYERIPIVIITAAGSQEILKKAQALGANSVLEKPFTAEAVKQAVRQAYESR